MIKPDSHVSLEIQPPSASAATVKISGALEHLHQDPKSIHQLLDLLQMPKGTEVRVVTTATSSIVR